MKLNKIMLAAAMTFGAVSLAQAASEGSGQINFTGSIVDAPCSIKGESIRQDINLGGISKALLAKKDGHSTPQQVNIQLENCDLTDKNGVTLTFSGIANDKDQSMLALAGNASDAGIVFIDSRGEKIKLGEASQPAKLAGTSATLSFNVYVAAASASTNIVPGDFTAVTNFELAYQ